MSSTGPERREQILNVALGGTLIQHIPDSVADPLAHEQPNPRNEPGHVVKVARGTQLHQIVGADQLDVNSAHHQAAADAPKGVVINATAPDGVIEGIEAPQYRFCIGVQWHPEFQDPQDASILSTRPLLDEFVNEITKRKKN